MSFFLLLTLLSVGYLSHPGLSLWTGGRRRMLSELNSERSFNQSGLTPVLLHRIEK